MRDRTDESAYYGLTPLPLGGLERVFCLAPHPDDEVLGCGGLLAILAGHGRDVRTIVLTDGEAQSDQAPLARREESAQAAQCLRIRPPEFWGFKDRGLRFGDSFVNQIVEALEGLRPTHLLVPSLSEPHPDHQATALAGLAAAYTLGCDLLFYEAAAPLIPSHLLDISEVLGQKTQAMACFSSQQAFQDYRLQALALGQLRAHGYPGGARAAEAFFYLSHSELLRSGPAAARCDALSTRVRLGLANSPKDLPLVSVIVRSTGRPSLQQALDCITAQTYSPVETVLVDSASLNLGRSQAANYGLERARGDFALFLDDDDLIDPHHLSRLVACLLNRPQAVAAYGGVRLVNAEGRLLGVYDEPWALERLQAANFIPIHAVVFRLSHVRERQLRFDVELPVLEDWSFWLDLAAIGPFEHCPGPSATYRRLDRGSGIADAKGENHWEIWQRRILEQRCLQTRPQELVKTLAWHGRQLADRCHQLWEREQEIERLNRVHGTAIADLQASKESLVQGYDQQLRELLRSREDLAQAYEQQLRELLRSREELTQGHEQQLRELLLSREAMAQGYEQQLRDLLGSRESLAVGYEQQMRVLIEQQLALSAALAQEQARLSAVVGTRLWRWSRLFREALSKITGRGGV